MNAPRATPPAPRYFAATGGFGYLSGTGSLELAREWARHRARLFHACHVFRLAHGRVILVETVYRDGSSQLLLPGLELAHGGPAHSEDKKPLATVADHDGESWQQVFLLPPSLEPS